MTNFVHDSLDVPAAQIVASGQDLYPAISRVSNVGIIARGYENFITKLEQLGADFTIEN